MHRNVRRPPRNERRAGAIGRAQDEERARLDGAHDALRERQAQAAEDAAAGDGGDDLVAGIDYPLPFVPMELSWAAASGRDGHEVLRREGDQPSYCGLAGDTRVGDRVYGSGWTMEVRKSRRALRIEILVRDATGYPFVLKNGQPAVKHLTFDVLHGTNSRDHATAHVIRAYAELVFRVEFDHIADIGGSIRHQNLADVYAGLGTYHCIRPRLVNGPCGTHDATIRPMRGECQHKLSECTCVDLDVQTVSVDSLYYILSDPAEAEALWARTLRRPHFAAFHCRDPILGNKWGGEVTVDVAIAGSFASSKPLARYRFEGAGGQTTYQHDRFAVDEDGAYITPCGLAFQFREHRRLAVDGSYSIWEVRAHSSIDTRVPHVFGWHSGVVKAFRDDRTPFYEGQDRNSVRSRMRILTRLEWGRLTQWVSLFGEFKAAWHTVAPVADGLAALMRATLVLHREAMGVNTVLFGTELVVWTRKLTYDSNDDAMLFDGKPVILREALIEELALRANGGQADLNAMATSLMRQVSAFQAMVPRLQPHEMWPHALAAAAVAALARPGAITSSPLRAFVGATIAAGVSLWFWPKPTAAAFGVTLCATGAVVATGKWFSGAPLRRIATADAPMPYRAVDAPAPIVAVCVKSWTKAAPAIDDSQVTIELTGEPLPCAAREGCFPYGVCLAKYPTYAFCQCKHNTMDAAIRRLGVPQPAGKENLVPFIRRILDRVRLHAARGAAAASLREMLQAYVDTRPTTAMHLAAVQAVSALLTRGDVDLRDLINQVFTKVEKTTRPDATPRVINPYGETAAPLLCAIFRHYFDIVKCVYKRDDGYERDYPYNGRFDGLHIHCATGDSIEKRSAYEKCRYSADIDGEKFDAAIGPFVQCVLNEVWEIYHHLFEGMVERHDFVRESTLLIRDKNGFRFMMEGLWNCSGHGGTSCFSFVANAANTLHLYEATRPGGEWFSFLDGDDNMIQSDSRFNRDDIIRHSAEVGIRVTVSREERGSQATFCSHVAIPCGTEFAGPAYVYCGVPARVMRKHGWSEKALRHGCESAYLRGVMECLGPTWRVVPVLRAYYELYMRTTPTGRRLRQDLLPPAHTYTVPRVTTQATWDWFFDRYGLFERDILELEDVIASVTELPAKIDHWVIDRMCEVDEQVEYDEGGNTDSHRLATTRPQPLWWRVADIGLMTTMPAFVRPCARRAVRLWGRYLRPLYLKASFTARACVVAAVPAAAASYALAARDDVGFAGCAAILTGVLASTAVAATRARASVPTGVAWWSTLAAPFEQAIDAVCPLFLGGAEAISLLIQGYGKRIAALHVAMHTAFWAAGPMGMALHAGFNAGTLAQLRGAFTAAVVGSGVWSAAALFAPGFLRNVVAGWRAKAAVAILLGPTIFLTFLSGIATALVRYGVVALPTAAATAPGVQSTRPIAAFKLAFAFVCALIGAGSCKPNPPRKSRSISRHYALSTDTTEMASTTVDGPTTRAAAVKAAAPKPKQPAMKKKTTPAKRPAPLPRQIVVQRLPKDVVKAVSAAFDRMINPLGHFERIPFLTGGGGTTASIRQQTTLTINVGASGAVTVLTNADPNGVLWIKTDGDFDSSLIALNTERIFPAAWQHRRRLLKRGIPYHPAERVLRMLAQHLFNHSSRETKHRDRLVKLGNSRALTTDYQAVYGLVSDLASANASDSSWWARNPGYNTGFVAASTERFLQGYDSPGGQNIVGWKEGNEGSGAFDLQIGTVTGLNSGSKVPLIPWDGDTDVRVVALTVSAITVTYKMYLAQDHEGTAAGTLLATVTAAAANEIATMSSTIGFQSPTVVTFSVTPSANCTFVNFYASAVATGPVPVGEDWYAIPAPDADLIVASLDGVRECTAATESSYTGTTLDDSGLAGGAIAPSGYAEKRSLDSLDLSSVLTIVPHTDHAARRGLYSFLPYYGIQQEEFCSVEDFLEQSDDFLQRTHPIQAFSGLQPDSSLRVLNVTNFNGPTLSQALMPRADSDNAVARAFLQAACSVMNPTFDNPSHSLVLSAISSAFELCLSAATGIESVAKFIVDFGAAYRKVRAAHE